MTLALPSFSCTCPSRKHPCKHALGLLLLWAGGQVPAAAEPPAWVQRQAAAKAERVARKRAPDPEAQARRAAARAGRIGAGLEELDRWLHDLVRSGLAAAQARSASFWGEMAARLVDAQAPGAAGLVRRLGRTVRSGTGWEGRALAQAGRLHLLACGWARRADLGDPARAGGRARVGWPVPIEDVRARPASRDRWHVAGRWETPVGEGERLRVQRTWLWGEASGRPALVLEFALPTGSFRSDLAPGTVIDAEVAFYPGPAPLRAVVAARWGLPEPMRQMPGWMTIEEAFAAHGDALARDRFAVQIDNAVLHLDMVARQADHALDVVRLVVPRQLEHHHVAALRFAAEDPAVEQRQSQRKGKAAVAVGIFRDEEIVADEKRGNHRARRNVERLEREGSHHQCDQDRVEDDFDGLGNSSLFLFRHH